MNRALSWFIAPPATTPDPGIRGYARPTFASTIDPALAAPPPAPAVTRRRRKEHGGGRAAADPAAATPPAGREDQPEANRVPALDEACDPDASTRGWSHPHEAPVGAPDATAAGAAGAAWEAASAELASVVTSAAVLGRPGQAEPVAAALALALRRQTRAKAAAVAVIGPAPAEAVAGGGGGAAARRLAARLEAHALEPRIRGRLVWVRLDPADPGLAAAVRRVTLIAAPAVLAVTAPRTPELDEALAEQDLLVLVTDDPDGPLAHVATSGLPGIPVVPMRPLTRGPARALARAGRRPPGAVRQLVPPTEDHRP